MMMRGSASPLSVATDVHSRGTTLSDPRLFVQARHGEGLVRALVSIGSWGLEPSYLRRKLPCNEIVGIVERAACCWNRGQEFMTIKPVNEGTVR